MKIDLHAVEGREEKTSDINVLTQLLAVRADVFHYASYGFT